MSSDLTYVNANGYWSTYVGSGASANLTANSAWAFAGNFTFETHFFIRNYYHSANELIFFGQYPTSLSFGLTFSGVNAKWQLYQNSTVAGGTSLGMANTDSKTLIQNRWNHIALVRNSSTITLYVNGTGTGTTITNASSLGYSANPLVLTPMAAGLEGYFYNFRITNTAVYTSNFTPSNTPYTSNSSTLLLTFQDSSLIDRSSFNRSISNATANILFSESYLPGNASPSTTLRTFAPAVSIPTNTIEIVPENQFGITYSGPELLSKEMAQNVIWVESEFDNSDTVVGVPAEQLSITFGTPGGTVTTSNAQPANIVQYWG